MLTEAKRLIPDNRPDQAERVANFLELHPESTAKEIDQVCDTGCITKVLSDMCDPFKGLGFALAKGWRWVTCEDGRRSRRVRTYTLISRTHKQRDLFKEAA